jgi:hypothetical protein
LARDRVVALAVAERDGAAGEGFELFAATVETGATIRVLITGTAAVVTESSRDTEVHAALAVGIASDAEVATDVGRVAGQADVVGFALRVADL